MTDRRFQENAMSNATPLWRQLVDAATEHAANAGHPDYEVGDLQFLFEAAFGLLSSTQQKRFFRLEAIRDLLEVPEFEDLQGLP
jgi:hypothetical protein